MIRLLMICLILTGSAAVAQTDLTDTARFRISVTAWNHVDQFSVGIQTVVLTDTSVEIWKQPNYFDTSFSREFHRRVEVPQAAIQMIRNLRLDTLKDYYHNACIMGTSGNEYTLSVAFGKLRKTTHLHHYYLPQVDAFYRLTNGLLPEAWQQWYLQPDTEQDCGRTLKQGR